MHSMQRVLIHGPPGSGKTVLSKRLCALHNLEHIATGELLSEHIAKHTTLGQLAQNCIDKNAIVPDAIVIEMVRSKIKASEKEGKNGWVLDGFPRTLRQYNAMLVKRIVPLCIFILELSEAQCIQRMIHRLWDPITREIHSETDVALISEEAVRKRLCKRHGDTLESALQRMEAFHVHGKPTLDKFTRNAVILPGLESVESLLAKVSLVLERPNSDNQLEEDKEPHTKSFEEAVRRVQTAKEKAKPKAKVNDSSADNNFEAFEEMLVNGINIIKHGRHGSPHMRTIYSDLEFQRIFWQKPQKRNEDGSIPKHPRLDQSIARCDILRVAYGASTNVLKRCSIQEKQPCFLSLITNKRSLDLEAENVEMAHFLGLGFQKLIECNLKR